MKIAVVGTGYVGLVTGTCLADVGHQVVCIDHDATKVQRLRDGQVDIYEPNLEELVKRNTKLGHLNFSGQLDAAILDEVRAVFICVGTPPDALGNADMRFVYSVADSIGKNLNNELLVICKSTAPVGTSSKVRNIIEQQLQLRGVTADFDVASNPEFLKEGSAVNDFMRPDRIIVGTDKAESVTLLREIYAPFNRNRDRMLVMSVHSSELTKYAANAMLATKISFINEIANIADRVGADIESVRHGIGSDPRIGYDFIYAGCGYGGSCFPKDVAALVGIAEQYNYHPQLISAVDDVNNRQKQVMIDRLLNHFGGDVRGKTVAIWGLSFKPNTNDIREAPSRIAIEYLLEAGATIKAYDPVAMPDIDAVYGDHEGLELQTDKESALEDADALMIFTEWKTFKVMDFALVKEKMANAVIFDGRNLYEPERMKEEGLIYYGIGRSSELLSAEQIEQSSSVINISEVA